MDNSTMDMSIVGAMFGDRAKKTREPGDEINSSIFLIRASVLGMPFCFYDWPVRSNDRQIQAQAPSLQRLIKFPSSRPSRRGVSVGNIIVIIYHPCRRSSSRGRAVPPWKRSQLHTPAVKRSFFSRDPALDKTDLVWSGTRLEPPIWTWIQH
jgi:hypothetical protein